MYELSFQNTYETDEVAQLGHTFKYSLYVAISGSIRLQPCTLSFAYRQGCGLGLDVSVSRRSRDLPKVSSRSRLDQLSQRLGLGLEVERLGLGLGY